MDVIQEKIQFTVDASQVSGNSLSKLLTELRTIDAAVDGIFKKLGSGPVIGSQWLQPVEQLKARLDKAFAKTKGPYAAGDVLKSVGLDDASVNRALARLNELGGKLKGFQTKGGTFASTNSAALGVSQIFKAEISELNKAIAGAQTEIGKALRGQGGNALFSGKDFAVKVDGQIGLVIPGTQIHASVQGPIELKVGGLAAQGVQASAAGGKDPVSGQFTAGNAGGKGRKKKGGGGAQPLDLETQPGETARVLTERLEDGLVASRQLAVTRINELGKVVTEVHDSVEGLIKKVDKSATGNSPLAQYRAARKAIEENFKAQKAVLDPNDPGTGMATLYSKQASELRGLAGKGLTGLPAPAAQLIRAQLSGTAATLDAKALGIANAMQSPGLRQIAALKYRQTGTMSAFNWQNFLQGPAGQGVPVAVNTAMPSGIAAQMRQFYTQQATVAAQRAAAQARRAARMAQPPSNMGSPQWLQPFQPMRGNQPYALPSLAQRTGAPQPALPAVGGGILPAAPTPAPKLPPVKPSRLGAAFGNAFGPESMAVHTVKAAGWMLAITAIMKPLQLAEHSLKRFMDMGEQMAHLDVVFKKIGGSTQALTNDVIKLAAANGRSTDEAMESATEWARLGLTRVEINKAVQVSLEAANVAQISVGEATKQMSALMHIYGLNVGQLDDALGTLVNTSQKFNVTTEDLLGGLDRAAAAAKVAGLSFAELQGLIGATSGHTGQSGIQIGNTIKNLLTQFTRPEMQQYLQTQGIATLANGKFGGGSEVFRKMFIQYQKMDSTQQRNLGTVIAGRLQTARFAGIMESYPQAQQLAIDGLLRQNAALETNLRIVMTLKAQVHGLGAEWDRLILNSGSPTLATQFVRTSKNIIGAFAGMLPTGGFNEQGLINLRDARARRVAATDPFSAARLRGTASGLGMTLSRIATLGAVDWIPYYRNQPGLFDINNVQQEGAAGQRPDRVSQFSQASRSLEAMRLIQTQMETAAEMEKAGLHTHGSEEAIKFARENFGRLGLGGNATFAQGAAAAQTGQQTALIDQMTALAHLKDEADQALAKTGDAEAYQKSIQQVEKLAATSRSASDEELSSITEQIARRQEYLNLMKEQQGVMEGLQRLAQQFGTGTATGERVAQQQMVSAQVESLQAQLKNIAEATPVPVADNPFYQQTQSQLNEALAQRAALNGPRRQVLDETYDARAIAARRAQVEGEGYGVGYTEAEKLLRQQQGLGGELAGLSRKRDAGVATDNDIVRGMQLQVQLAQNHEKIQLRIVELKAQEKQLLIDAVREYQKSLLLSGPGELLKRLYAGTRGQMGTGQFMALDPETRRMVYDLHGGEAGAKNREEQFLLQPSALSLRAQQYQAIGDRANTSKWQRALPNPVAGLPGLNPPNDDPVMTQAYKSAAALGEFSKKLLTETLPALDLLKAKIESIGTGGGSKPSPSAPAPRLDVSGGHALGSQPPKALPVPDSVMNHWFQFEDRAK